MAEPTNRLAPSRGATPHRYTPSYATDIRKTFRRVRLALRQQPPKPA